MTYTKPILTIAALAASLIALPASASTQDDVQACRAAFTAQSNIDMSDYRLRFVRQDGITSSKARTLYIRAIGKNGQSSFRFSCQLNKTKVVALRQGGTTLFAAR